MCQQHLSTFAHLSDQVSKIATVLTILPMAQQEEKNSSEQQQDAIQQLNERVAALEKSKIDLMINVTQEMDRMRAYIKEMGVGWYNHVTHPRRQLSSPSISQDALPAAESQAPDPVGNMSTDGVMQSIAAELDGLIAAEKSKLEQAVWLKFKELV